MHGKAPGIVSTSMWPPYDGEHTRPVLAWLTISTLVLILILMPHPGSAQDNLPPKFVTGLLDRTHHWSPLRQQWRFIARGIRS